MAFPSVGVPLRERELRPCFLGADVGCGCCDREGEVVVPGRYDVGGVNSINDLMDCRPSKVQGMNNT